MDGLMTMFFVAAGIIVLGYALFRYRKTKKDELLRKAILQDVALFRPRPAVKKALEIIESKNISPGTAIEFGPGFFGYETIYLLKKGYQVTAIDNWAEALAAIQENPEVQKYRDSLTTILSNFEDLEWDTIAPVDLFVAEYSLNFGQHPDQFFKVWAPIITHIKPGGYFVGEISDTLVLNKQADDYFSTQKVSDETHQMDRDSLAKKRIRFLFKDFDSEYFDEDKELYKEYHDDFEVDDEDPVPHKTYTVIAKKKSPS